MFLDQVPCHLFHFWQILGCFLLNIALLVYALFFGCFHDSMLSDFGFLAAT